MKELSISEYGGSYPEILIEFIMKNKMPFKLVRSVEDPTQETLDKHLKKDRAVIMFFRNKKVSHVFLIVKDLDKAYVGINYMGKKGPTISSVPKNFLDCSWETVAVIVERITND
jgi:hypothetical protein